MSAAARPDKASSDRLYGRMTVIAASLAVTVLVLYFSSSTFPFESTGYLLGRDFVNTWMGAQAALDGHPQQWFDTNVYNAALKQTFGAEYPEHHWSYPPHLLLATWPLGFLPYMPALALWSVLGFALYMVVASDGERRLPRLLMLAAAPAVLVNLIGGQNGFFTAVLLIGGLSQLDRRPVVSGILFGILTIKPQLGLLLPLMLVLGAQWRAIAAAAATALTLAGVTSGVFGTDIWAMFLRDSVPRQTEWMTHGAGIFLSMMPTAFMNMRIAGTPLTWAWAAQVIVSAGAVAAVIWTFWRPRERVLSTALLLTAMMLVTPYAFNYDMVVFGWILAQLRDLDDTTVWDDYLALAVWTLPLTMVVLGLAGIPISCLVMILFAGRLLWRLSRVTESAQTGLAHSAAR